MLERKDISGFMLMCDDDGIVHLQVVSNKSNNMSVVTIDAFNVNIADMLDSLMPSLDVAESLADESIKAINLADLEDSKEEAVSDLETTKEV